MKPPRSDPRRSFAWSGEIIERLDDLLFFSCGVRASAIFAGGHRPDMAMAPLRLPWDAFRLCLAALGFDIRVADLRFGQELDFLGCIFTVMAVVWGAAVRAITLWLAMKDGRTWVIHLIAFAALLMMPGALLRASEMWEQRPLTDACREAVFDVHIAGLRFAMPVGPIFSIATAPRVGEGLLSGRSLTSPADRREFCAVYDNGNRPVDAARLSVPYPTFDYDETSSLLPSQTNTYCARSPAWVKTVCSGRQSIKNLDAEFPTEASVLSAQDFPASGTQPTEAQSRTPRPGSPETFVKTVIATPDGKPLTFACRVRGQQEIAFCRTNYPWRDGAHITFSFSAPLERVEEMGPRFDAAVRRLFESLLKQ